MAGGKTVATGKDNQLQKLRDENRRLRKANTELRQQLSSTVTGPSPALSRRFWRSLAVVLCIGLAGGLLVAGNLLFWAGNTIVKTDRYVEATAPIIKDPVVQNALANKLTQQLFTNVDVDQVIEDNLPPRVSFLGPTLAAQAETQTENAIKTIVKRPQFQQRWIDAQTRSHERFIRVVGEHGSDGSININEVYGDISQQLKDTRLAFLADKPLPAKVGDIQVASGSWLTVLQRTIQNIDTWRVIAIVLLLAFSALGIWLSRNRRRVTITLASTLAVAMFLTLVSARLVREVIASQASPEYAEAVRHIYSTITHPLAIQTWTLFAASLLVVTIAWLSGNYKSSRAVRRSFDHLLSGRLHQALFSRGENSFTRWLGAHKTVLQWIVIAVVALSTLFVRLTPETLLLQIGIIAVLVFILEVLASPRPKN